MKTHKLYISPLGKRQKKNPPLMAGPLRGGGGGKGRAIKEKRIFNETFFILLPLKIKIILLQYFRQLIVIWKYHVKVCRQQGTWSVGIFTCLFQYLPKNRAILVPKLQEEKKLSKTVSAILRLKKHTKKVPMAIKLEGGGGVRP